MFVKENSIDFSKTIYCICGFKLFLTGKDLKKILTTWYDFTVQQGYLFLKNIFSAKDLSEMDNLKTLEDFYDAFEFFLEVVVLLKKRRNLEIKQP